MGEDGRGRDGVRSTGEGGGEGSGDEDEDASSREIRLIKRTIRLRVMRCDYKRYAFFVLL